MNGHQLPTPSSSFTRMHLQLRIVLPVRVASNPFTKTDTYGKGFKKEGAFLNRYLFCKAQILPQVIGPLVVRLL